MQRTVLVIFEEWNTVATEGIFKYPYFPMKRIFISPYISFSSVDKFFVVAYIYI